MGPSLRHFPEARRLALRARALPWGTILFSLAVSSVFCGVLSTWFFRIPSSYHFSGLFQGDMPTYLCYARVARHSPTLLSYANPHDLRDSPVPIFVNVHLSVMGWLIGMGLSPTAIEMGSRLVLGTAMFTALGAVVRHVTGRGPLYWPLLLLLSTGGGVSWLATIEHAYDVDAWMVAARGASWPYYWWFLDLFRNLMYPPEILFHLLMFAMLAALGRRRYDLATIVYGIACASNPFIGVQTSGVMMGLALVLPRRAGWKWRAAVFAIAASFGTFYRVLVGLDDVGQSIQQQHFGVHPASLTWDSLLVGHGPALLGVAALLFDARFRRLFVRMPLGLPILGLAAWTMVLMLHGYVLEEHGMQPMHFSRGYFFLCMWLVCFSWLRVRMLRSSRNAKLAVGYALALFVLPDNLLFLRDQYVTMPNVPILVFSRPTEALHRHIASLDGERNVLLDNWFTGGWLCATTDHHFAFGTPLTTPHYAERRAEVEAFRSDPSVETPVVQWADMMAVMAEDPRLVAAARQAGWIETFHNSEWYVFERPPAPEGSEGGTSE